MPSLAHFVQHDPLRARRALERVNIERIAELADRGDTVAIGELVAYQLEAAQFEAQAPRTVCVEVIAPHGAALASLYTPREPVPAFLQPQAD